MTLDSTRLSGLLVNDELKSFGWRPDIPDYRDFPYTIDLTSAVAKLPDTVRLDQSFTMPPVYDQGSLGSCTANALAAAMEFDLRKQGLEDFMPSRLFIYYNERVLENSVADDAGAEIRDGAKTLHRAGVCSEKTWPYDIADFAESPSETAYFEAMSTRTVGYGRVARTRMRSVLASGTPFTIGFTVYDSFRDIGDNGMMPMPSGSILGGHAVLICGYAVFNGRLYYRARNSWSTSWGDAGYFWMPAEYLLTPSLSQDFWAIRTVS